MAESSVFLVARQPLTFDPLNHTPWKYKKDVAYKFSQMQIEFTAAVVMQIARFLACFGKLTPSQLIKL